MALLHDNNLTAKEVQEKFGIAGITKVKKAANASAVKKDRFSTNSYRIDKFIYEAYPDGQEFTTDEMSAELREKGWQTSEISGQMNGKKKSGLLANRKPTDEEATYIGKGKSIWHATPDFYEKLSVELEEEARQKQASQTDEATVESLIEETNLLDDDGLDRLEAGPVFLENYDEE